MLCVVLWRCAQLARAGAYGGGFPRFQETPLKTTKTNKILCSFRLDPGNKVKL